MGLSKLQKTGVAAVLGLATIFGAASTAQALEVGCQPAQIVRQQMANEGQFKLVEGQAIVGSLPKNIFTSNERGSLGYHIEAGTGADADKLCVNAKYTDIKVNTNSDFARPSWVNFGANSEYGKWLTSQEIRDNEKVLFGATSVIRLSNGKEVKGSFIIVTSGNLPTDVKDARFKNSGSINLIDSTGKTQPVRTMANVDVAQPNYENFANRKIQTAQVDLAVR